MPINIGLNLQPHKVTLLAKTTKCVGGGQEATYSPRISNFPAMVAPASSDVKLYYAQRQLTVTHTIYTSSLITAVIGDVVQLGSRLFSLHGAQNIAEYGFGALWQLDALEITGTNLIIQMD